MSPQRGPVRTDDGSIYNYIIVIDAGSSGSRIHIYHYPDTSKDNTRFPEVNKSGNKWIEKIKPGISSFADNPQDVGKKHLKKLVKYAKKVIPKEQRFRTPIFLHATAGMRLLEESQSKEILSKSCEYLKDESPFYIPDCNSHLSVIEGEVEGLFGWLGMNYLIGGINDPNTHHHGKNHSTYGFMDMGGASTQITFVPNATEIEKHSDRLYRVSLSSIDGGSDALYDIYSKSYLGSGVREARKRYLERLKKNDDGKYHDACMPKGYTGEIEKRDDDSDSDSDNDDDDDKKDEKKQDGVIGTGKFDECSKSLEPLLDDIKNNTSPDFDFEVNHFVAVSEYWDMTDGFEMGGSFNYKQLSKKVKEFCERDWSSIKENSDKEFDKISSKDLEMLCFKANWMLSVINEGFDFPQSSVSDDDKDDKKPISKFMEPLQTAEDVNGVEFSWTLGRALLYASSELGKKNNNTGVKLLGSDDLSYGSEITGRSRPDLKDHNDFDNHNDDDDKDSGYDLDDILDKKSHRVWGSLVFLGILLIIVYLLLGKVRRRQIWESIKRLFKRTRNSANKLGGSQSYQRLQDTQGQAQQSANLPQDAEDFELREVEDNFDIDTDEDDNDEENHRRRTAENTV